MNFRVADTFTDSLSRLTSEGQKLVKTTAFDLQLNPANPGMSIHKLDKTKRTLRPGPTCVGVLSAPIAHQAMRDMASATHRPVVAGPYPHLTPLILRVVGQAADSRRGRRASSWEDRRR